MNCPICGLGLKMEEIQEHDDFALVRRSCNHCRVIWSLKHQNNLIVSITQEGMQMEAEDYGFDYKCPHCGHESYVATVLQTYTGWKCINCGKIVPEEQLKPRGDFVVAPRTVVLGTGRSSRRASSIYQRAPRTSRPIPAGAVSLVTVAERLKVEPKKLRSWLRKVNWRAAEEAKSAWVFSEAEAEEVIKNFGK